MLEDYILVTTWDIGDGEIAWSLSDEYNNLNAALMERDNMREKYAREGYHYEVYKRVTEKDY